MIEESYNTTTYFRDFAVFNAWHAKTRTSRGRRNPEKQRMIGHVQYVFNILDVTVAVLQISVTVAKDQFREVRERVNAVQKNCAPRSEFPTANQKTEQTLNHSESNTNSQIVETRTWVGLTTMTRSLENTAAGTTARVSDGWAQTGLYTALEGLKWIALELPIVLSRPRKKKLFRATPSKSPNQQGNPKNWNFICLKFPGLQWQLKLSQRYNLLI